MTLPSWAYDPFKGAGKVLYAYADKVVWSLDMGDQIVTCVQRRIDPLLDDNQRELNDNAGKRWGEGRIAARIPLDLYFEKIMPAKEAGDDKYIKRFYNDRDYYKLRTFPGSI